MSLLAYTATAVILLWIAHRSLLPVSRVAAALLFLFPFCLTGYALVTDAVYGPVNFAYATEPLRPMAGQYGIGWGYNGVLGDVACQMIPWRKAVQWSLQHHQWPIFNPFMMSGDILAAAAQPAAYSPFTLIACLLPVAKSITYSAAISFFIAGLGAFLFARELGLRESASLVAAAGFMYSTAVSYFIEWPLAGTWIFLPLVLLGVRRVVRDPGIRPATILAIAFTLMLLAGHPETALHIVLLGAIYALFEIASARRAIVRAVIAGVVAGVAALLLCAVYILPILEAAPQTNEHLTRTVIFAKERPGAPAPLLFARLATDVFPFLATRSWRVAGIGRIQTDCVTVGSVVLAFAIYAMWRVRSRRTWFFALIAIFCTLEHADWGPIARLLKRLPLFDITLNERLSFGGCLFFAILGAIGFDSWLAHRDDIGAASTSTIVLVILGAGTVLLLRSHLAGDNVEKYGDFKVFAEIAGLAMVSAIIIARLPPRWSAAAILGVLLLQRTMSETGVYDIIDAQAAYPPVPIFEPLRKIREPFRVTGASLTFIPNMSALYELEDVRGYQAMTLLHYVETFPLWCIPEPVWFNRVNDLTKPFVSFLNVRFAVVWAKFPTPDGWRVFAKQRGTTLLENTRVIERAFVPRRVALGAKDSDAFAAMSNATDFRDQAWIRASSNKPYERDNGPGHLEIKERPHGFDIQADMERDGWIVISQAAWPGWRGYIDGRRVRLQIANMSFLSIYVPAGRHRVKLTYLPQSFVAGRAISAFTLLGIIIFFATRRILRAPRFAGSYTNSSTT